jgi:TolA-binding protein
VVESRQMLEKRVKEVHTQRLKVREEMLEKLFLLEEKIKNMEMKTMKKQNFPFIKFEESICKKLQEFFSSLATKEKLRDMDKIVKGALSDARAKLKDCQAENQGLIR